MVSKGAEADNDDDDALVDHGSLDNADGVVIELGPPAANAAAENDGVTPQYKDQARSVAAVVVDTDDHGTASTDTVAAQPKEAARNQDEDPRQHGEVEHPLPENSPHTTSTATTLEFPGAVQFISAQQQHTSSTSLHYKDQIHSMVEQPPGTSNISDVSDSGVPCRAVPNTTASSINPSSRIPTRNKELPPLRHTTAVTTTPRHQQPIETVRESTASPINDNEGPGQEVPLEAIAIHDASQVPLVDAVQVVPQSHVVRDNENDDGTQRKRKKQRYRTACVIAITVLVFAVVLSVSMVAMVGRSDTVGVPPTPTPTTFPTFSPLVEQERTAIILADLRSVTNVTYPSDSNDPSAVALHWLLLDDPSFPIELTTAANVLRLRDRYAVACLYFHVVGTSNNTTGKDTETTGWMIYDHCDWDGVDCNGDSRVSKLVCNDVFTADSSPAYNGQIPNEIGLLTHLTHLELSSNHLIGTIPAEHMAQLTALTRLSLGDNSLTGTLPDLSQLSLLEHVSLHQNNLFGRLPTSIGALTELREMELNNNILTGHVPTELGRLTQLTALFMDRNRLSGPLPSTMVALGALQYFWIHDNRFSGEIPAAAVLNWTDFADGFFHNNDFTGVVPFCEERDDNGNFTMTVERLVADCQKVDCPCCTHCCPTAFNGIRQSFACAIG